MEKYKDMTYDEFLAYCNDRACDGAWSYEEAIVCIEIVEDIESIKIKKFGFPMRKKTKRAKELMWDAIRNWF